MITDIAIAIGAGAAAGTLYFLILARSARLMAAGARARIVAPLLAARLSVALGAFAALAKLGAVPLLVGFAGFLAARQGVFHWARRQAAGG